MPGMATTKITVTVPEELAAHIRREVEQGRYGSVSAFATRAVESMRDFEPLDLLIASMIAETGEPDEAAERWVEQAMATARKTRLADDDRPPHSGPGRAGPLGRARCRARAGLAWRDGEVWYYR